jgi:hypothetical protein
MKYFTLVLAGTALTAAVACAAEPSLAEKVERAHGIHAWWGTQVLQARVEITFGDKKMIDGTAYFESNGPRARLDLASGERIVFDGSTCWVSPADATVPMARFHVLTWPWFIAAPFKVRGEGTQLEPFEKVPWEGKTYWGALQTFEPGEGDYPEDWYYL